MIQRESLQWSYTASSPSSSLAVDYDVIWWWPPKADNGSNNDNDNDNGDNVVVVVRPSVRSSVRRLRGKTVDLLQYSAVQCCGGVVAVWRRVPVVREWWCVEGDGLQSHDENNDECLKMEPGGKHEASAGMDGRC